MNTVAELLSVVKTLAPYARIEQYLDGNIVIVLNARLADDNAHLEPLDADVFDAAGE
jgi:hypothetical protein